MSKHNLSGVPATLLITVWARAQETLSANPVIHDPYAVEIYQRYPELFLGLESLGGFSKRMGVLGCAVRTKCFDREVERFLAEHPTGVVVNIGAGLDARSLRLDNGTATWFDVDVSEVQAWRRKLLPSPSPRHHTVDGSLLEPEGWLPNLPCADTPAFVISEGTLMYFGADAVRALFAALTKRLGSFRGFTEIVGDLAAKQVHPAVRAVGADSRFQLSARNPKKLLESMHPGITIEHAESLFDHEKSRWSVFRWMKASFPSFTDRLSSVLFRFSLHSDNE